jgi:hypothetical protein
MTATERYKLAELVMSEEIQTRAKLNLEAVNEYAELYRAQKEAKRKTGKELPNIAVFLVGKTPYVVDGFHRVAGAILAEMPALTANIEGAGSLEEAQVHAATYNHRHGAKRTAEDKRRTVARVLALKSDWTDTAIADHCGVHRELVSKVRNTPTLSPCRKRDGDDVGKPVMSMESAIETVIDTYGEGLQRLADSDATDDWDDAPALPDPMSEPSKIATKERRMGKDGKLYPVNAHKVAKKTRAEKADKLIEEAVLEIRKVTKTIRAWAKQESDSHVVAALNTAVHDLEVAAGGLDRRKRVPCPECDGLTKQIPNCTVCGSRRWVTAGTAANLKPRK